MTSSDGQMAAPSLGLGALIEGAPLYRPVSAYSPLSALIITAVACLAPLVLFAAVVALAPGSTNWERDVPLIATPGGIAVLAFSQLFSLAIIWLAAGRGGLRQATLRLQHPKPGWSTSVGAAILLIAITGVVEIFLYKILGFELFADTKWLLEGLNSDVAWGVAIVAVVLAPLWEELTFRGFLLSALANSSLGYWPAALITTGFWTLLHWGYSFAGMMSVFVAGLLLSWLMQRLGSMRVVVVAHSLANAVALLAAYLFAPG